tara:strand:- start:1346 stop:1855 length:510 start_codon:yes stop_codon:yes gene_type:complete
MINNENIYINTDDISKKIDILSERLYKIENYLQNNRELYIDLLENINNLSIENKKILTENREMYTKALKKIEETEIKNMNEIRPIINNIGKNNQILENNILSPFNSSRVHNRFWRRTLIPSHNIQENLKNTIPEILETPLYNQNKHENENNIIEQPSSIDKNIKNNYIE